MDLVWARVVMFLRAIAGALADFQRLGCLSLAASVSFFTLLSFFPMVFLLLYGISFIVGYDEMNYVFLLHFLQGFLPGLGAELADEIKRVASEQIVHWLVLATFAWFGTLVFYEMDYAVHVVFGTARTRNPLISTIMSVLLLGLVELLLIGSYLITQVLDMIVSLAPEMSGIDVVAVATNRFLFAYLIPFICILIAVTCIYRFLPKQPPTWDQAIVGGLVLTLLWELAKHLFSTYVQNLAVYGRMYGSLLVVVMFLLWVYYSAALFLYSAAVVRRLQILNTPPAPIETPAAPA